METNNPAWDTRLIVDLVGTGEHRSGRPLTNSLAVFLAGVLHRRMRTDGGLRLLTDFAPYAANPPQDISRALRLLNVGDSALILSGLFPRYARRRGVAATYYIGWGQTAYGSLANLDPDSGWQEAHDGFVHMVDVLLSMPPEPPLDLPTALSLNEASSRVAANWLGMVGYGTVTRLQ